jgi:integrase
MRVHDLRHLCASLLLAEGVQPRVLMEILGHSQISLTLDTYAHVMPSAHTETALAMERAMNRPTP